MAVSRKAKAPALAASNGPVVSPLERKQFQEMELLLRVSKQVAAIDTLDELLKTIVELSAEQTDADRGTLFLNDDRTSELYSRVAQGARVREIRIMNNVGTAGHVFTTGKGIVVHDAYNDPRFDAAIDRETGYTTKSIVCAPIRTARGEIIGVLQMLNKKHGEFNSEDLRILEAMTEQTALTLRTTQFMERMSAAREQEMKLLDVVADITSDFDLGTILSKIVGEAAQMVQAERATLFLNDEKTNELFARVATGGAFNEIRLPNSKGIAGAVFTTGKTINIPHAYADLRFNPAIDKQTGYFTRSLLCVPIIDKSGKVIGATQALNKKGGPFTQEDEARLKAFTAQLAISLQNAKLFDDVQNMKNYNDSMLQSMTNGVVTLNEDGKIVTCNRAGLCILRIALEDIVNKTAQEFFAGANSWILERIKVVDQTLHSDITMGADLMVGNDKVSVNLTALPLMNQEDEKSKRLGTLLMIEDISAEKRMKSTMSRYMDPRLADQLLAGGTEALGGKSVTATVLFSDVRNFTGISEELGAQATISLLNEYFTAMVEVIQKQGGMLDKFIGDAIMAVFGLPIAHEDDEDRAVRAAIGMITELRRFNADRVANGKKPIDIGIGLNTDVVVSGNLGSPKRMDYTIIGDGVNLASRLESACKQYSTHILLSENTFKKLQGIYRVREVDHVIVKGKHEPAAIYEVLDYHTDETFPNLMDAVNQFKSALSCYRKGSWDKAAEGFRHALELNPNDALPKMYIDRCETLKANPPADWNGVWVMKTK
ncbi:MAG TPA: GAF domain-containing protein [Bryobacteraceae bacterium]|nr:GAF domain-containing protein [Bryobacteraceae bacterium]